MSMRAIHVGRGAVWRAWVAAAGCCLLAPLGCSSEPDGTGTPRPSGTPVAQQDGGEDFAWPSGPRDVAVIELRDLGEIRIALYPEIAPATVENFLKLVSAGFYDGTLFHRVIPGFMIQGGDPNSKDKYPTDDGYGGPGYKIADEYSEAPHERGVVSMANLGQPDTAGSQFFIVHQDARHLDGKYSAFGQVLEGMDVVDHITELERDEHGRWGPKDRPIERVEVVRAWIEPGGGAGAQVAAESRSAFAVGASPEAEAAGSLRVADGSRGLAGLEMARSGSGTDEDQDQGLDEMAEENETAGGEDSDSPPAAPLW